MEKEKRLNMLVIDDDWLARNTMEDRLKGHAIEFAVDFYDGLRRLESETPDMCFIDLQLGKEDREYSGLGLVEFAAKRGIYTVVVSGHDTPNIVERAYASGCKDFFAKGAGAESIRQIIDRFRWNRQAGDHADIFTNRYITNDPHTRRQITELLQHAPSQMPVMMLGPSGTGKTSVAQLVHEFSGRKGEFVAINCAAYCDDLLEAELFGYREGAFTGAAQSRRGMLKTADQGTLFLDEVGSMSLNMQAKLLKAIEERKFYPLGSETSETSNFRLISATLENLDNLLAAGRLRLDFFERIRGVFIDLKPLAERTCDILPLIEFFTRNGRRLCFTDDAREALRRHPWPGNIRQLKRLVDLLAVSSAGIVEGKAVRRLMGKIPEKGPEEFITEQQYEFAMMNGLDAAVKRLRDGLIGRTLKECGGVRRKVLKSLQISGRALYSSLERHQPSPEKSAGESAAKA